MNQTNPNDPPVSSRPIDDFLPVELNARFNNPYTSAEVATKQLTAKVGIYEWDRIRIGISMKHGHQDQFISTLIHRFYDLTRNELPLQHDITSESALVRLVARLTLAPVD